MVNFILRRSLNGRTSGRLFQSNRGTPLAKGNVRRYLLSVLKRLGLKKVGLHAFRHGRVSVLQSNGVPGDLVKEWVGHSSLRTTSRYTHFSEDYRQKMASGLGLFSGKDSGSKIAHLVPTGPNSPKFEHEEKLEQTAVA